MVIYLFIFSLFFFIAFIDICCPIKESQSKILFRGLIVLLVFFKGLRWDTGSDWSQYYVTFENSSWGNIFSYARYGKGSTLMEPGYMFLNILIKTLFGYYTFFLLITNAIILYIYGKTIERFVPEYKLATLALLVVSTELFPVRTSLAFAVFCFSFKYILDNKFWKYAICIAICFFIHRSTSVLIILYPVLKSKFNYIRSIVIYIILIFASQILYNIFDYAHNIDILNILTGGLMDTYDASNENLQIFQESGEGTNNNLLTYISSIAQLTTFYFCCKLSGFNEVYSKYFNLSLNVYFVSLCIAVIGRIPGFGSLLRYVWAFSIGYSLCIGLSICVLKRKKYLLVGLIMFCLTFFIKFKTEPFIQLESDGIEFFLPYKSFLQQDEPIRSGSWAWRGK